MCFGSASAFPFEEYNKHLFRVTFISLLFRATYLYLYNSFHTIEHLKVKGLAQEAQQWQLVSARIRTDNILIININ